MGEVSRRMPAAGADRGLPRSASPAVGGAPSGGVARVTWRPVAHVGWDVMPAAAGELLAGAGLCVGVPVAAWAYPARVRRLHGGGFVGDVEGWWVSAAAFVAVRARRPLVPDPADERRYRPTGAPWRVVALTQPLTGTTRTQRWRRPPTPPGHPVGASTETRHTNRVLDLLPAAVQEQLGQATEHGGARFYPSGGGYREQVVGYRRDPARGGDRLVVVAGERSASAFPDPEQAIADADWVITTLEAVLGPATTHHLAGAADRVSSDPDLAHPVTGAATPPVGTGRGELSPGRWWRPRGRGG